MDLNVDVDLASNCIKSEESLYMVHVDVNVSGKVVGRFLLAQHVQVAETEEDPPSAGWLFVGALGDEALPLMGLLVRHGEEIITPPDLLGFCADIIKTPEVFSSILFETNNVTAITQ